jgi:hypothetical protein
MNNLTAFWELLLLKRDQTHNKDVQKRGNYGFDVESMKASTASLGLL